MSDFNEWFEAATNRNPFAWQSALADSNLCDDRLVRIPTGFGKTLGVLSAWAYHRIHCGNTSWPIRLIWTLPMRVLVEQTEDEARTFLTNLGLLWDGKGDHRGKVGLHTLMGGADAGAWHLWPEQPAVLVGTQDMLLSRALNRGYGAARARWPADFGLLSQDALWVLDEVQLMDVGLATAAQLASFRKADRSKSLRPAFTWAMSATLQRDWVTKSPDTGLWAADLVDQKLGPKDQESDLWRLTSKPIIRQDAADRKKLPSDLLTRHAKLGNPSPLTLVVLNTVERACELYKELRRATAKGGPCIYLLHSRFRGAERNTWRDQLLGANPPLGSRIIVATQVVEAGVDLSADLLVTEICPWASLVQRLGRLARRGGSAEAIVLNLDRDKKNSLPYEAHELEASWNALDVVCDGSPRSLELFELGHPDLLPYLYPYEPPNLLLREELDELFDTTPDLSGNDLDISRFIRSGDERDLSVFWVDMPPTRETRPIRNGLVSVPFLQAADWLFGKGTKDSKPMRLPKGTLAWVWDYLEGRWRLAQRSDLRPGQTLVVDHRVGGYSVDTGWDPTLKGATFPLVQVQAAEAQEQADSGQDGEELSLSAWQTVGFHGGAVAQQAMTIAQVLAPESSVGSLLSLAARWHDLGKTHSAFQGALIGTDRPQRSDLAKGPDHAWRKEKCIYQMTDGSGSRPGFRHELASLLAWFAILERHAEPEHPSRLGKFASIFPHASRPDGPPPGVLESEILALPAEHFDLAAYMLCCHHGKLRARLQASPADQKSLASDGTMAIRGVKDGDTLPETDLFGSDGKLHRLPSQCLCLEPASMGLSPRTGRSWSERVSSLQQLHGPFTLAYLESLIRAADVRASRDTTLIDGTLEAP
ncbi:DEAD/DEAH box helicase [bacterium]|nr:DEAD/DEAH box helicase [bacterium]